MRSLNTGFTAVVALGLLLAVHGLDAATARTISVSLSPSVVEFTVEPGAAGSHDFTIKNGGTERASFAIAVEPHHGATDEHSAVEWLRIEPATIDIEPGTEATVSMAIDVPADAPSGGRYALLSVAAQPADGDENSVGISGKVGAALLFIVDGGGELRRQVEIEHFGPVLEPDGRIGFRADLRNAGNLHLMLDGVVEVSTGDGEPVASLPLAKSSPFLPGGRMVLPAHGSLPVEAGQRYAARLSLDYGADDVVTASVEFDPEAGLDLERVTVCEHLDRGPGIEIAVANTGAVGLEPVVQVAVRDAVGNLVGSAPPLGGTVVWSGDTLTIPVTITDRLASGDYVLSVRADLAAPDDEGRVALPPLEQETPFAIGGLSGNAVPLCDGAGG